jgi:putative heme utilization radical SAM enzyme HutW
MTYINSKGLKKPDKLVLNRTALKRSLKICIFIPKVNMTDFKTTSIFQNRIRSAAELKRLIPIEGVKLIDFEELLTRKPESINAAIYIHIPFCHNKCNFCGYYKCLEFNKKTIEEYVNKVVSEIEFFAKYKWSQSKKISAIYFGGGTPTSIDTEHLVKIIQAIKSNFELESNYEITLESSIKELGNTDLDSLVQNNVNRMSLGVQSFNTTIRQANSRRADKNDILQNIKIIKDSGIENICIDLIYNLKGQSLETWNEDFETLINSEVQGVSIYPLLPFPNAEIVLNKSYKPLPIDKEYDYFETADNHLLKNNWTEISPVQYARNNKGDAKYIQMQAKGTDIFAFGPSSGGKIEEINYLNRFSIDEYLSLSFDQLSEKKMLYKNSNSLNKLECIFQLCRTLSCHKQDFELLEKEYPEKTSLLKKNNLIEIKDHYICLSQAGKFWSANIIQLFLL